MASKAELIRFLDSRVFNPILKAKKEDYKEADQKALADVQQSTKSEKERFRSYKTAAEVRSNYLSDLNSKTAKRINQELRGLKLPRLPDFKEEFLALAGGESERRPKTKKAGG